HHLVLSSSQYPLVHPDLPPFPTRRSSDLGTFQFPTDTTSMDIRDVIARQGGFSPVAKGDAVAVTRKQPNGRETTTIVNVDRMMRPEEHTSELQSRGHLVCRLLLEKKKTQK